MVTTLDGMTADLVAACKEIRRRGNGHPPILCAHSEGGGTVQYALDGGLIRVEAMALIAAREDVEEFKRWMPAYESLAWPIQMMGRGFVDCMAVLRRVRACDDGSRTRVLMMAGTEDKFMTVRMTERMAEDYRAGIEELRRKRKKKKIECGGQERPKREEMGDGFVEEDFYGVRFVVGPGAHHIQNGLCVKESAEAFRRWLEQL